MGADTHGRSFANSLPSRNTRKSYHADYPSGRRLKLDQFPQDTIALEFQLADGTKLEFNEAVEGWADLAQGLHHYLLGSIPFHEWFKPVAFPAFQINFTVIFKRRSAPQVELQQ